LGIIPRGKGGPVEGLGFGGGGRVVGEG